MTIYNILGSASDAYMMTVESINYNTVRDANNGAATVLYPSDVNLDAGQYYFFSYPVWKYNIPRVYLFFDCTSVPEEEPISSAALDIWVVGWTNNISSVIVQGGMPTYPHDPVVIGDYGRGQYSDDILAEIIKPIESTPLKVRTFLTAAGRAAINKGGWTKFCLRADTDFTGTPPPSGYWYARFYSYEQGVVGETDYRPYLAINPTLPSAGYIWTHNNLLRWTDEVFAIRGIVGEDTTENGTAGYLWVEGTYVHYISQNGDERRQQGITTGDTGTPSQIWIQSVMLHYIDASGDERVLGTWFLDVAHLDLDTVIG